MPVLIGLEVRVFLLRLVCEIVSVELAGSESEKSMVMKKLSRSGRVLGVRGFCGDGHQGMGCECLSLHFMILMKVASMKDEKIEWDGREKCGVG